MAFGSILMAENPGRRRPALVNIVHLVFVKTSYFTLNTGRYEIKSHNQDLNMEPKHVISDPLSVETKVHCIKLHQSSLETSVLCLSRVKGEKAVVIL